MQITHSPDGSTIEHVSAQRSELWTRRRGEKTHQTRTDEIPVPVVNERVDEGQDRVSSWNSEGTFRRQEVVLDVWRAKGSARKDERRREGEVELTNEDERSAGSRSECCSARVHEESLSFYTHRRRAGF